MSNLGLQTGIGQIGAAILITDLEGNLREASAGLLQLFGREPGQTDKGFQLWDELPVPVQMQLRSLAGVSPATPYVQCELPVMRRDGQRAWIELRANLLLDEERKPAGILHVCHDTSWRHQPQGLVRPGSGDERSDAASQGKRYQRQKIEAIGTLAAGLAHDFNNLLTAILSHIDLVLSASEFPSSLQRHLVIARTSGRRAAELVSRLQTFSRQSPHTFSPIKLAAVVHEVVSVLKRTIDRLIQIQVSIPDDVAPVVNGDATLLMQCLMNLCLNARDAMPGGGTLTISMEKAVFGPDAVEPRKPGAFVRISVTDTGAGMEREVLSRLFEPYFTTKEFGQGGGLGLAITNSIVRDHGGWMEVESEPGKGSRFDAYFAALNQPAEESKPAPIPVSENQTLEGKETILLVDDEELVRLVARAVLGYRGYHIMEAIHGLDAVEKYRANADKIDLVLMDLHMPRMNGWDALARIRELDPSAQVIMLSGGSTDDLPDSLKQLGAAAILQKPFENIELVELVRRTLDSAKG
jgi:signal transduction histidine kinase/ActR/RegA family two-component response regulator